MSVFSKNILWQSFTGQTKSNPVNVVAQRFLQVFHDHGLQAAQIPRLLPQIKLDDLKSEEALLVALTPDVLDQTAHLFGIRTAWIEGVDNGIYDCLNCYKQPKIFFENLALINRDECDSNVFYVQTLVTTKQLDINDLRQQLLVVVVAEKIAELGEQRIYRYHVYGDGWDWGYAPTRIQLKAMARMLFKNFGKTMPIYTIKLTDLENIREGRLIPRRYLGRCLLSEPSLEDYAMAQEENFHAKEIAELPEVLEYIEEHNLENHIDLQLAQATPPIDPAPVQGNFSKPTAPASVPAKSGKRAINDEEVWNPVEFIVQAWWSENDSLLIGDAVKRIQLMPHLKASKKSSSSIHKRIAKFAPPNVRGKSGRKPK